MKEKETKDVSRRKFLGYSALGFTGLTILPSWTMANGIRIATSDRIVLEFIGVGEQWYSDRLNHIILYYFILLNRHHEN